MQAWETSGNDHGDDHGVAAPELTPAVGVLVLSDVYLLTAASDGRQAVAGLSLQIDDAGMTVRKPDGSVGARMAWSAISRLDASGRMRTPGGSPGVVVQAASADRTHRFLVPARDPAELERQIEDRAASTLVPKLRDTARRRQRRGAPRVSRWSWWRRESRS
jgi:hypothetical protein